MSWRTFPSINGINLPTQQILHCKYLSPIISHFRQPPNLWHKGHFILMFALVRLSPFFPPIPSLSLLFSTFEKSCMQPLEKHEREQTCGSQRSQKSERMWNPNCPPAAPEDPAPEFPKAAWVWPWLDSAGVRPEHHGQTQALYRPQSLFPPGFTIIMKKSWVGSLDPTQTF